MGGDAAFFGPLKNGAGLDAEMLGSLVRCQPFELHGGNPFRMLPNTLECLIVR
jgi:hypothetical protein